MINCPKCQVPNPDTASSCAACGTALASQQFAQALDNSLAALHAAGGAPENVGRMTVYVTDVQAYRDSLKELGAVWRPRMGRNYPAMALVGVTELVDLNAMVEIETTAVIPPATEPDNSPRPA